MFARIRSRMTPTVKSFRREGYSCDTLRVQAYRIASSNLYS